MGRIFCLSGSVDNSNGCLVNGKRWCQIDLIDSLKEVESSIGRVKIRWLKFYNFKS